MNNISKDLLSQLTSITEQCIADVESFRLLSSEQLNFKKGDQSWSILECLEHLNLYGDFYLKEIDNQIDVSKYNVPEKKYKSGLLGRYFYKSMKVKEGKIKGMKTFANMDPKNSNLPFSILERFLQQQQAYLAILKKAKLVNLTKTKTSISISKLIKLRLCDTLMVVVYHNERHVWQAKNIKLP